MRRSRSLGIIVGLTMLAALTSALQARAQTIDIAPMLTPTHDPQLIGARLLELALAIVVGFVVGAFFSPGARPLRKALLIGTGALFVLYVLFGPDPMADYAGWVLMFIGFCAALFFGLRLGRVMSPQEKEERPTSFGSAKWATFDYLAQNNLFGDTGFLLGAFDEGDRRSLLRYEGARHLLTVAPTRSGKGVSSIIPNLLLHRGSSLVVDPKGENALITAPRRGKGDVSRGIVGMGQDLVLLDPWDIAASRLGLKAGRFNPLDWIKDGDPDATENAFLLADALVIKEGGGDSAFWDEEAKALLTGVILFVATDSSEVDARHLGRVRDILTQDDEALKETLLRMFSHPHPVVSSTASRTAGKDAKLRSSVLASAQAHTHFLDSPRIRESLSASDFAFEDLKTKPLTIYLILPADRLVTFSRWMRLLIQQAITVNARNISEKPAQPILFMLDEMATIGRLPSVEQAFGLMAGFGMQIWGVVQDLSQLAKIYGEHGYQTFVANSGVIQYMGSRDKMTAEYFSSLCGVTTIKLHNFSWAIGQAVSYTTTSSSSGSSSSSTSGSNWGRTHGVVESQRQLIYPDELMVLKGNQQIVFVENLDPITATKVVWHTDANLRGLGVNLQSDRLAITRSAAILLPT